MVYCLFFNLSFIYLFGSLIARTILQWILISWFSRRTDIHEWKLGKNLKTQSEALEPVSNITASMFCLFCYNMTDDYVVGILNYLIYAAELLFMNMGISQLSEPYETEIKCMYDNETPSVLEKLKYSPAIILVISLFFMHFTHVIYEYCIVKLPKNNVRKSNRS